VDEAVRVAGGGDAPKPTEIRLNDRAAESRTALLFLSPRASPANSAAPIRGLLVDITERKRTEEALARSRARLATVGREMEFSEARERKQLAEDLHDSVCQLLAVVGMNVGQLEVRTPEQQDLLADAQGYLTESIQRVPSQIFEIRPVSLYEFCMSPALDDLAEECEQHRNLVVAVACGELPALSESVSVPLFRMARELLINVSKHAGVGEACLTLDASAGSAILSIQDEGRGFDWKPEAMLSSGYGIWSMRDRVELHGGTFDIDTAPGNGTRVTVSLPLMVGGKE
jgi:signal transduction histidine kinase